MTAVTSGTIPVYLDTDPCERADADRYGLALYAVRLAEPWNGWAVPVVTAAEFTRFIGAWRANDPNGEWHPDGITEGDGALVYRLPWHDEEETEMWTVVGMHEGKPVYAIDGWTFTP